MRKNKVSTINFTNGARYECFVMGKVPSLAKDANDYIYLKITPEKGRGKPDGYYMNIYDANNLIWALTTAILAAQERGISHLPQEQMEERLLIEDVPV